MLQTQEKLVHNERMGILKAIPELQKLHMARSKLATFVKNFEPMVCLNKQVIYRQGEPKKYIYIVRQGEFTLIQRIKESLHDASKPYERPNQHAIYHSKIVNQDLCKVYRGHILGVTSAHSPLGLGEPYDSDLVCSCLNGELLRMQVDVFAKALAAQTDVLKDFTHWFQTKSQTNHRMQGSKLRDPLKPFLK